MSSILHWKLVCNYGHRYTAEIQGLILSNLGYLSCNSRQLCFTAEVGSFLRPCQMSVIVSFSRGNIQVAYFSIVYWHSAYTQAPNASKDTSLIT